MDIFTQFTPSLQTRWETARAKEPAEVPFSSFSWHAHWLTCFGKNETLSIFADPYTEVILPLCITDRVAHFSGGEEIADYLDAIGAKEGKARAWQAALPTIKKQGATSLLLRNIPEGSATLDFFRTLPHAEIVKEDTTPILPLPENFDAYLSSLDRKKRHEIKRKIKKFETAHTTLTFSIHEASGIQTAPLISLMRHDADKVVFLTPSMITFFEGLPIIAPDTLRQFVLTLDEKIIAATLAFRTPDSLLLYNSGFDPQYPGAGWYIKVKTIAWAIDQKIDSYNFLQGNERYKYDLGGVDHFVYNITLPL